MGDWLVVYFNKDNPKKGELVDILANVPLDWEPYLKKVAEEYGKSGRYIPAFIMYNQQIYHPPELKEMYEAQEKKSSIDDIE